MRLVGKSTRLQERIKLNIPLQVRYLPSAEREWLEETRLSETTRYGAGFILQRPVEPERLVHLTLPLPRRFRAFDFNETQYRIWAVVRHVRLLQPDPTNRLQTYVGVAFIGKNPPASYRQDPTTRYDLKPILEDNLWSAREMPRYSGRYARVNEPRYPVKQIFRLEPVNERGEIGEGATIETENISESGAAALTKLALEPGQFVRLSSEQHNISLLAVVRGCQALEAEDLSRLHLEFISGKAPSQLFS